MKKGHKRLTVFIIFIMIVLLANAVIYDFLSGYGMVLFLAGLLIFFNFYFVMEKDRHRYLKDIIIEVLLFLMLYFVLFYLLGLITGLAKVPNYYTVSSLITIILPLILYIILREVFRYNMLCKADGNTICIVMVTALFIFLDLAASIHFFTFKDSRELLGYIAITLLPTISKNISYSYISRKMGYKPVIIFDLIFTLYPYLIRIIPNPSEYVLSIIYLITPILFAYRILKFFDHKKDELIPSDYHKKRFQGILLPTVIIVILVYFYSGYFRFYAIAVASESMQPKIHKGDMVLVDQKYPFTKLEINEVIAFRRDDIIVVHRIVKKVKMGDKWIYYTKGDANNNMDDIVIEADNYVGKVGFKIPLIGYPTVWFNKE